MPESDPTRQQTESVRHLVGDKSAFEAFYRATVARLVRFLMLQGAPHPDATEIAQETLIKAYQRWHAIDNPRTWSYRVASRDWIRRATSVKEEPVVDLAELTPLSRVDPIGAWSIRHELITALERLPHRQRQVMAWTFSGYTPSEIAVELQLKPEQVRSNLRLARRRLAELTGDEQVTP